MTENVFLRGWLYIVLNRFSLITVSAYLFSRIFRRSNKPPLWPPPIFQGDFITLCSHNFNLLHLQSKATMASSSKIIESPISSYGTLDVDNSLGHSTSDSSPSSSQAWSFKSSPATPSVSFAEVMSEQLADSLQEKTVKEDTYDENFLPQGTAFKSSVMNWPTCQNMTFNPLWMTWSFQNNIYKNNLKNAEYCILHVHVRNTGIHHWFSGMLGSKFLSYYQFCWTNRVHKMIIQQYGYGPLISPLLFI